ncbi:hypothetical protein [Streptomyces mexicanus]
MTTPFARHHLSTVASLGSLGAGRARQLVLLLALAGGLSSPAKGLGVL